LLLLHAGLQVHKKKNLCKPLRDSLESGILKCHARIASRPASRLLSDFIAVVKMWLLKVSDRGPTLVSISDDELEPDITGIARTKYAIVSHRWEADDEEVTFDEMRALRQPLTKEQSLRSPFTKEHSLGPLRQPFMKGHSLGYRKIRECCELARARGYQYLWIDTCCIDKRSSAELSEAINSMFHWSVRSIHFEHAPH